MNFLFFLFFFINPLHSEAVSECPSNVFQRFSRR